MGGGGVIGGQGLWKRGRLGKVGITFGIGEGGKFSYGRWDGNKCYTGA